MTDRATYLAQVEPDEVIRVYADDWEHPAATIVLPHGMTLRDTLADAEWRPTGRRAPSGERGSIFVERMQRR